MKIAKLELLNILKKLKPAVGSSNNSSISNADCFVFNEDTIVTFNEEIAIIYPLVTGIKCAVPADELMKFVTRAKGKDVIIEHEESKINLTSGKSKAVLIIPKVDNTIHDAIDTLEIPSKFLKLPENFAEGLRLCSHSFSKDITDVHLCGINVVGNKMQSSDDFRISEFTMDSEVKKPFLLFGKHAEALQNYNVLKYYKTEVWLYFLLDDDTVFCSRIMIGNEYPEVDQYFDFKGKNVVLPKDLCESVDVAAITSTDNDKAFGEITVKIADGVITCTGKNNKGESWKASKIDFEGSVEFAINPEFLNKILKVTSKLRVGKDRCLFDADGFRQLFSLKK